MESQVCFFLFLVFSNLFRPASSCFRHRRCYWALPGEIKPEYTSYFREFNVMSFVYLVAWFHLFATGTGKIKRALITVISLVIAALMGSKASLIMIVFLLVTFYVFHFMRRSYGRKLFVQISAVLLTSFFFIFWVDIWKLLLDLFAKISPGGALILSKLRTQDILTVVFSTRNLKALALLDMMQKKGLAEWLFGIGATDTINGNVLIESDPFDVFKVYGLIGIVVLYIVIVLLAWRLVDKQKRLKREAFNSYVFFYGVVVAIVIVPPLTGHIFSSPGGMLFLGLIFGALASEKMRSEMEAFWKQRLTKIL